MFTTIRKLQRRHRRNGISIIEVLTSMAVATIGVFGVMVMIPFAVKQSQIGLDNDAANALGRNAVEDIKANGFLEVENNGDFSRLLIFASPDGSPPGSPPQAIRSCSTTGFANERAPGLFHFDPVGFAEGFTSLVLDPGGDDIEIYSTTASRLAPVPGIGLGAGGVYTPREASQLCHSQDDLFHEEDVDGESDEAVAPPQPLFNINGTAQIKRQSGGRISWSAFIVPEKDPFLASAPLNRLRTYAVAYHDRYFSTGTAGSQPRVSNRDINPLPDDEFRGTNYDYYLTNMSGTGFVNAVSQVTFDATDGVEIDREELVRGDWVMLVNRIPEPIGGASPPVNAGIRAADEGYRVQIMFARVTRVAPNNITIDGGAFDFVPSGITGPAGTANPASSETYLVHLKNVVNVFERSATVER